MKILTLISVVISLIGISNISFGQESNSTGFPDDFSDEIRGFNTMRVVFYNVENLFHPDDDSLKRDDSFTPKGMNHWTTYKYWKKQNQIAQVITAVGGWEMPTIVGLCEVENKRTLVHLTNFTSLKKYKYGIVHHESPDWRGIDVAMIYRYEKFKVLFDTAYSIRFAFDTASRTRDILYVKGLALETDTMHIFITHWPSKYGGAFVTIPKRKYVAKQIRKYAKQILKKNPMAKILIMGDLNDSPNEESVMKGLKAKPPTKYQSGDLVNLMYPLMESKIGSHFYAGETGNEWSVLDQMIISSSFLDSNSTIKIKDNRAHIFSAKFLLEQNAKGIIVPNRTFHGMRYHGGFSDHLPVYLDIWNGR